MVTIGQRSIATLVGVQAALAAQMFIQSSWHGLMILKLSRGAGCLHPGLYQWSAQESLVA